MAFPNDPGGTLITDWPFTSKTGSGGPSTVGGNGVITTDAGDPQSPPSVLHMDYPVNFTAGNSPDTMFVSLGGSKTEAYLAFTWAANANWQQEVNSGMSKWAFFVSSGTHDLFVGMAGPQGGPYRCQAGLDNSDGTISNSHVTGSFDDAAGTRHFPPNVATVPILTGNWYTIELYTKFSTNKTSQNGILRCWVNGTLVTNYTTVNYNTSLPWVTAQLSPVWGSASTVKTQPDWFRFGHMTVKLPTLTGPSGTPTISSFTPTSGTFGTPITIVGTNFDPNPGGNSVTLNNTACPILGAQATQINTAVPNTATTGRIRVATSQGQATSSTDFTVIDPETSGGLLLGSRVSSTNTTLSNEGTLDWAHWGLTTAEDFNHKSGA